MSAQIVPDSQWKAPATLDSKESMKRVQDIIGDFDPDHTMKYYDYWSQHYEKDLEVLDYTVPDEIVDGLLKFVPNEKWRESGFQVLDIGLGTGQMAIALHKKTGYSGPIDGVDGNEKMMEKARVKGMYRDLKLHLLMEDSPMPNESNKYDVVVCCCAMVPGLIQPECLPDMVRVVKPGGYFFFTTRSTDGNQGFKNRVDNQIKKLQDSGHVRELMTKIVPQYSWPTAEDKSEKQCISAILYGMEKLKATE
ncbi:methyltransferase-like protein 27 [Styela clava]|uniref:ubiquinone biosynthesis O-methyltransferase-like n=1 Tax=Styela clava TaxID=7725 RepID=UPI00193A36B4|nr:ubiquinone biosynthesis O-methyltransferase-like [Styela clava]XP_039249018.1 ubiquinone biosynthesis O-methyltransferase-like [Styela clava]